MADVFAGFAPGIAGFQAKKVPCRCRRACRAKRDMEIFRY